MEETAVAVQEQREIVAGFGGKASFDLLIRQAQLISSSTLVPEQFSIFDKKGKMKNEEERKCALSNATIAMEMAARIGASPLMVCQNLYIVQGRPSWSSQFTIAAINASGKFSPLRFTITEPEPLKEVTYQFTEWEGGSKVNKTGKEKICNRICTAWAIEKGTGERLESPPVSMEMAVKEGWYSKAGSKWQTMEELMLRYRAAAFFGRLYAPDLLMGIKAEDEVRDIVDITPTAISSAVHAPSLSVVDRFKAVEIAADPETGELPLDVAETPSNTLQALYMLICDLANKQGETANDMLDLLTGGKCSVLEDLAGKSEVYLADLTLAVKAELARKD